jgi:hypothetical protein
MGYTHYWTRPKTIPVMKFSLWTEDVRAILLATHDKIAICGPMGNGPPVIRSDEVALNGTEEGDLAHDTFQVPRVFLSEPGSIVGPRRPCGDFTKTERKPYDLVVVASLIRLKLHVPKVRLSSDGDSADWGRGVDLCTQVFGEGHETPDGIDKVMCKRCQERVATRCGRVSGDREWSPYCTACFDAAEDWIELNFNPFEAPR